MGAWNTSLVGNDTFQDEMSVFRSTKLSELSAYFSRWYIHAKTEAAGFMLDEDHLPLDFDEENDSKDEFLFNEEQETDYRTMFLGLIDVCLQDHPNLLKYFTQEQLDHALEYNKQLCHYKILEPWVNPDQRLNELFLFKQRLENHLSTLK